MSDTKQAVTDEMVEAAARAITVTRGVDPETLFQINVFDGKELFDREDDRKRRYIWAWRKNEEAARAALEAALATPSVAVDAGRAKVIEECDALDSDIESFWCITTEGSANRLLAEDAQRAVKRIRSLTSTPSPAIPEETMVRALEDWSESDGDVVWWCWRDGAWLGEPAYIGTPLDLGQTVEIEFRTHAGEFIHSHMVGGWPGHHTHWTPHPSRPEPPLAALPQSMGEKA